eukprot:5899922-Pyramimonas_sp.AAC.1
MLCDREGGSDDEVGDGTTTTVMTMMLIMLMVVMLLLTMVAMWLKMKKRRITHVDDHVNGIKSAGGMPGRTMDGEKCGGM